MTENAFTKKPDLSGFIKEARARAKQQQATTRRVTQGGQHFQSRTTDIRKGQVNLGERGRA